MYNPKKLETEILAFLKNTKTPINCTMIAINIGVDPGTCKKTLKRLIATGEVSAIETTKNTLFAV